MPPVHLAKDNLAFCSTIRIVIPTCLSESILYDLLLVEESTLWAHLGEEIWV